MIWLSWSLILIALTWRIWFVNINSLPPEQEKKPKKTKRRWHTQQAAATLHGRAVAYISGAHTHPRPDSKASSWVHMQAMCWISRLTWLVHPPSVAPPLLSCPTNRWPLSHQSPWRLPPFSPAPGMSVCYEPFILNLHAWHYCHSRALFLSLSWHLLYFFEC